MYKNRKIAILIPAYNEAPSIARVLTELTQLRVCANCAATINNFSNISNNFLTNTSVDTLCTCCGATEQEALVDDIIVCDNGSTDATAAIAEKCGAMVVKESRKGYGAACLAAMNTPLDKDIVVFVDGDHSVVAEELPSLLDPLLLAADMVIGSRTLGDCEKGALSLPQRWGNRVASALMRLLWNQQVTDLGPFRALTYETLLELGMQDTQFGWTVEMQVRAFQRNKKVVEIPVTTRRRIGKSKIGGTVRGVIGASKGILGTIAKLYWVEFYGKHQTEKNHRQSPTNVSEAKIKTSEQNHQTSPVTGE